jgi:hypothetical protein
MEMELALIGITMDETKTAMEEAMDGITMEATMEMELSSVDLVGKSMLIMAMVGATKSRS